MRVSDCCLTPTL